jgi:Protein kinase domain
MHSAAASDPLGLVGSLLEKKYRVDARVAEGGFGVVYAGRHIGLGRPLAIKALKRPPDTTPTAWGDMIGQFLEEARLVAKLRHPAVVTVMDAGVTPTDAYPEGLAWIVMEWLDGETLAADLARRRATGAGGRTRAETLELLRPVIDAVAEAHHAGIIHRDLTPNNVMLVPGRHATSARILDFGIAKVMLPDAPTASAHTTTRSGERAFSLAYAAPEQLSGARTGPWTDVHALGLVVTEVLCGRPALPGDDLDAHYRATFAPLRPTPATLGVDAGTWEPVLARALALDPRDRHGSAGELLAALDGAIADPAVDTAAAAPPAAAVRGRRLRLAVLGAAALAVGVTWFAVRGRHGAESEAPVAKCTSNAACTTPGAPAICRPEVGCTVLRSQDCEPIADPRALESDATVWIGAMFPRSGPDGTWGAREVNAVELARRDFAQVMSGASADGAAGRARPFGLVVCDDTRDFHRAAQHLVDIGVPAVIGLFKAEEAIELTTSLFLPRRILAIASLSANPLVTRVPHPDGVPRLVWRTTYTSTDASAAIAMWIAIDLEPSLRASVRDLAHRQLRIALVRPRNAAGDALGEAFLKNLHFNGKSAIDNGTSYRELTTEAEAPKTDPAYAQLQRELLGFGPDIIIYAANVAVVETLFAPLEAAWPETTLHRPRYISVAALSKELLDYAGTNGDRRGRFFGITPVSSTTANARFVTHYNEAFPDDKITRTINPNSSYDAFYLLAYASYAIGRHEAVTGERLSRALGRLLPPGTPIEAGIAGIYDAYGALNKGASIDFTGATGKLDFDVTTGESAFDQAILCVGVDERGQPDGIESGRVYVASSKRLEGKMHCP